MKHAMGQLLGGVRQALSLSRGGVLLVAVVVLLAASALRAAQTQRTPSAVGADYVPRRRITLRGMDAVRLLYQQGRWAEVKRGCYIVLWDNIDQPEALYYLATSLDKLGERDQAAVYYHLTERELTEREPAERAPAEAGPSAAEMKQVSETRLKVLDSGHQQEVKQYEATASGKSFTSPQEVSDLWMSQVEVDLTPPHGLYLWTAVGGRKDKPANWIHNAQGIMHHSGAKYVAEIDGRKGVLFCALTTKMNRRVRFRNVGKGDVLRIGVQAYHFPFVMNVIADEEQLFSIRLEADVWRDLEIPLGAYAGQDVPFALELVVPPGQGPHEGLWLDYVDFFEAEGKAGVP